MPHFTNFPEIIDTAATRGTVAAMTPVCVPANGGFTKQAGFLPSLGFVMTSQPMLHTQVLLGQAANRFTWTNRYPVKGGLLT